MRIAAIVPACGAGRRMGGPKLTLPVGPDGEPMVARVVRALREGGVGRVLVVVPAASEPGAGELARVAAAAGAEVLAAEPTPREMRESVERGLDRLESGGPPKAVAVAPADAVGMDAAAVAAVLAGFRAGGASVVVPAHAGRRGHPLVMAWSMAAAVRALPAGAGLNALLRDPGIGLREVPVEGRGVLDDVDTPEDYARWRPGGGGAWRGP
jgi:molybdenum cofactor cytidylyltransferase